MLSIRQRCEDRAKQRAKINGACAWYDCAVEILTTEEYQQVNELWKTMNGSTCWNDAFLKWINNLPEGT